MRMLLYGPVNDSLNKTCVCGGGGGGTGVRLGIGVVGGEGNGGLKREHKKPIIHTVV